MAQIKSQEYLASEKISACIRNHCPIAERWSYHPASVIRLRNPHIVLHFNVCLESHFRPIPHFAPALAPEEPEPLVKLER